MPTNRVKQGNGMLDCNGVKKAAKYAVIVSDGRFSGTLVTDDTFALAAILVRECKLVFHSGQEADVRVLPISGIHGTVQVSSIGPIPPDL